MEFKQVKEYINNKQYYYCKEYVDDVPVPVKIIQYIKSRNMVEITRNFNGKAGTFKHITQLLEPII